MPKNAAELEVCVHNSTVKRVRQWLLSQTSQLSASSFSSSSSFSQSSSQSSSASSQPLSQPYSSRLLILSGKPGCGKSTTVRVLAKELGLPLREWNDTYGQVHYDREGDYTSHLDQFNKFLSEGRFKSLNSAGSGGGGPCLVAGGKKKKRDAAAGSGSSSSSNNNNNNGNGNSNSNRNSNPPVLLLESLPSTSFRPTTSSSSGSSGSWDGAPRESPIEQLRASLSDFLSTARAAPAVLIFSDVAEKNESSSALDRLLGKDIMASPRVELIEFNPITERKTAPTIPTAFEPVVSAHQVLS